MHFLRGDAEALDSPGLELVFFSVRWTELLLTVSKTFTSISRSPSDESVHRVRPSGGAQQAICTSLASDAPSNFRGRDGFC